MAVSNNTRLGLGALAAIAVGVGLILLVPRPQAPQVIEAAPEERAVIAPEKVLIEPKLDTLRVEADGTSVLAGRAEPLQDVTIIIDGVEIEVITADATGAFVAFPNLGYADASRTLTLSGNADGTPVIADETYLIAPLATPPQVVALAPELEMPTVASVPVVSAAPAVLVASSSGVRVLQSSGGDTAPEVLANVALDSISYDPSGDVLIAGRASAGGFIQVYLDNQPITTSRILTDGNWQTDLPDVDTGIYTLRVDEVSADGEVISRVETPFQREEPSLIAAQLADQTEAPDFKVAVATVQPGTTLWAIASERFGDGILYVKVFEANRDRIRNPDLIYPGQVFRIPEVSE